MAATLNVCGQGSVVFNNNTATRVYLVLPGGATTFVPVGSQFSAELLYAPDGTAPQQFDALAIRVGAAATFAPVAGLFTGGGRTVNSITPAGGFGLFQVQVWETAAGREASLWRGESVIMRVDTGDPTTVPPGTPAPLTSYGLLSFAVSYVPEPSVVTLALLGAGALFLLRRRK